MPVGADAHIRPAAIGRFAARVDVGIDPYKNLLYQPGREAVKRKGEDPWISTSLRAFRP